MKKTLLALALVGTAMSANAARVTGIPSYDLSSTGTTFKATNSNAVQYFELGTTNSNYSVFNLSFSRIAGSTRFSIFEDTDGLLNGEGDWVNSNSPLLGFTLDSLNTLQNITLAAGSYVLRLAATGNPGASANVSLAAVPLPAAAWLFGSALVGAGALRRKNKQLMVA